MKKFFKKFIKYFGVLLLLAVGVAGFKVANFLLNKPQEEEFVEPTGREEDSALTKIVDKFMTMDTAQFDLDFDIISGNQTIEVDATVLVDMGKAQTSSSEDTSGEGGFRLAVNGDLALGGQNLNFDISYIGDYIYADLSGVRIKLKTSNLENDIKTIMALSLFERFGVNVELPEISLEGIDTSILFELTSNLKEEQIDGGNKVTLDLFGYGDVFMYTDTEYNLKKVIIDKLEIKGTKISGVVVSELNKKIDPILAPIDEEELVDLTNITLVAGSVDELIEKGYISGNVDIEISKQVFSVKYDVDFKDFDNVKAYFETDVAGQKLVVVYENKKVYVAYDGFKYYVELEKFDIGEIVAKVEKLAQEFGLELPQVEIDAEELIYNGVGLLLSNVKDFNLTGEEIYLDFGCGEFKIDIIDGEFDNVSARYKDVASLYISLAEEINKTEINKNEFVGIEKLEEKINAVLKQLKEKKVGAKVTANINGQEIETTVYADFANDLKARVFGEFGEIEYDVTYENNYIYLNLNELKVKYELPNLTIEEFIAEVEKLLGEYGIEFNIPEVNLEELTAKVEEFDFETIFAGLCALDFKVVNAKDDLVEISVEGLNFKVNTADNSITDINLAYDNYSLGLKILSNDFVIVPEGKYVRINEALDYIPAIIDFASAKKYQIATTIKFNDILADVTGKVDITNGVKAQFNVKVEGFDFEITYLNEMVYINFNNKTIEGSVEEISKLISQLMPQEENTNEVVVGDLNLDILEDIIKTGNVLEVALKNGLSASFEKENDELTGVVLSYGDYSLALELSTFEDEIVYNKNEQVINVTQLYDFVEVVVDFIQNETIAFDIEFNYEDFVVTGKAMYNSDGIKAYVQTTILDRVLLIALKDNQIYLDFDGLRITCKINQIEELIDYVTTYAGVELPTIESSVTEDINISDIITNIVLSLENEVLSLTYEDLIVNFDTTLGAFNAVTVNYNNVSASLTPCEEFDIELEGNYIDLYELKELSRAVYNTLKNMSISGSIEVTLNMFGEDNFLSIDYAIGIVNERLIGYIETEFKGLEIKAYIDGEDVYLYVVGLKIHVNLNDIDDIIDWVNETFNAGIDKDSLNNTFEDLKNMKLDFISSVKTVDGVTTVEFSTGTKVDVEFDEYINVVRFEQGGREAILTCTDFSLVNLNNLNREEYRDYTEFTPVITNFYNFIMSSQYSVTGSAEVYRNNKLDMNISGDVQLDVTSALNAYVDINGLGEQITAFYQDKKLYFRYAGVNGLKISIGEEAIQEIASILLSAMGVDTSSIPFLDEFLAKEDIDTSNLSTVMPKIEFGNPLSYLEYIRTFEVTDSYFAVNIRGEKLGEHAKDKDVAVKIFYSEDEVTSIAISNLYTCETEYFNLKIDINDFTSVTKVDDTSEYIDLTNSKDLIRAFVNTSQLNDYHINGKIKLNIDIGLEFSMATINVDAKIKKEKTTKEYLDEDTGEMVVEEKEEIVGIVTLDNYPLYIGVNNANATGLPVGRKRKITMVLKGGYAYLMTEDANDYDRATKVTTDYLLSNLEYYMQYLLGFTDTIQSEINAMIEASRNYTGEVKYDEIISDYYFENRVHTIVLNLGEIVHSSDIGNLTVKLTTLNNDTTGNKDFLYRLDIDMQLFDKNGGEEGKEFDPMITLATDPSSSTDALFLVDIGQACDMTAFNKFIDDYDVQNKLGIDGEYIKEEANGAWEQANSGTSTVTFYSNGEVIAESTGNIASAMDIPTPTRVEDDGLVRKVYKFMGWYTDDEYKTQFTSTFYPRYNTVLFAKWDLESERDYVTINFETNQDSIIEKSKTDLEGAELDLPLYQNIVEEGEDENSSVIHTFEGWYLDANFTQRYEEAYFPQVIAENAITSPTVITLYAKWNTKTTYTYSLEVIYNGSSYETKVAGDEVFDLSIINGYVSGTSVVFDKESGEVITDFTVTKDSIWEIKNPVVATVKSAWYSNGSIDSSKNYEKVISTIDNRTLYNGDVIELETFANYTDDLGDYFAEYVFTGYKAVGSSTLIAPDSNGEIKVTVPTTNVTYVAQWQKTEYVYVTFDTTWAKPSYWLNTYSRVTSASEATQVYKNGVKLEGNVDRLERNVEFDPRDYTVNVTYKYGGVEYEFYVGTWRDASSNSAQCSFRTTPASHNIDYVPLDKATPSKHMTYNILWDANW